MMTQDGGNNVTTLTLLQRWKRYPEENRVTAALLLLFSIVVAIAGAWKLITGEHIWVSIKGAYIQAESYDDCIRAANDIGVEILKCKTKFGVRL
jgi:hypothetical protein